MKSKPLVYVITPVFNSLENTNKFLRAIRKQTYQNYKVVIIDDGSTDGTSKIIKNNFPEVLLLQGDGSLWWSGGTNLGVKKAMSDNADFVLTINNDVTFENNYISNLVSVAKSNKKSIIGSMVVYKNDQNRVWYAGATFDSKTGNLKHKMGKVYDYHGLIDSEWLTGMGVLIPIIVFQKVGFFNEKEYPQYFGDADFSLRAKNAGYRLIVDPKSIVVADLKSNWIDKSLSQPRISFVKDLFFSVRSPYQISKRLKFYKTYWPGNKTRALFKLYTSELKPVYLSWGIRYLRKFKKLLIRGKIKR